MDFAPSLLLIGLTMASTVPVDALLRVHQEPAARPVYTVAAPATVAVPAVPSGVDPSARTKEFDDIQAMRSKMCASRLHTSEKCMQFFKETCKTQISGDGSCHRFWDYLQKACLAHRNEAEYDMECKVAKELGIDVGELGGAPSPASLIPAFIPAMSPAAAPAGAPAGAVRSAAPDRADVPQETIYSKSVTPLPDQGYDEHSWHRVEYDGKTNHNKDWQNEHEENQHGEAKKICNENKDNEWCKRNYPKPKAKAPEPKQWYEKIMSIFLALASTV